MQPDPVSTRLASQTENLRFVSCSNYTANTEVTQHCTTLCFQTVDPIVNEDAWLTSLAFYAIHFKNSGSGMPSLRYASKFMFTVHVSYRLVLGISSFAACLYRRSYNYDALEHGTNSE